MIGGRVTTGGKAIVRLDFLDSNGTSHTIPMVLDTGFTGHVSLPERYVDRLGLAMRTSTQGHLANGEFIEIPTGFATIIWRNDHRQIRVLQLGTEPLVGMSFLWNHRITIDAVPTGAVSIAPLGG